MGTYRAGNWSMRLLDRRLICTSRRVESRSSLTCVGCHTKSNVGWVCSAREFRRGWAAVRS